MNKLWNGILRAMNSRGHGKRPSQDAVVPKAQGFEIEGGHHWMECELDTPRPSAGEALVQALWNIHPQEDGERHTSLFEFDSKGFRVYPDHDHMEVSSPAVLSAKDLVVLFREARNLFRQGKGRVESRVGPVSVSFNNTSRQGSAWGFHHNVQVSRVAFERWRQNDWAELKASWVPFLVSSLPLFGTGKVGAENGAPSCPFQLSQRADFMDQVVGLDTVCSKSLINTRDEPHADPARYARFHIIFYDTNLMEFANFLKFTTVQILLALIEEKHPMPLLQLKDPLRSLAIVSRDLTLEKSLDLSDGRKITAVQIQCTLAEAASDAIQRGSAASDIPDAKKAVALWLQTLEDLKSRKAILGRRLDWIAKFRFLQSVRAALGNDPGPLRVADLRFSECGGPFDRLDRAGAFDHLDDFLRVPRLSVPRLLSRERARAELIQNFQDHLVVVDWSWVVGRDDRGVLWKIFLNEPFDAQPVRNAVHSSSSWSSCLSQLHQIGVTERFDPAECILFILNDEEKEVIQNASS